MMEKHLLKKDLTEKSKEKNDFKKEILVKKKINLLSHLSLAKSPNLKQINLLRKKNQKNNDENNNYQEIKQKKIVFKKNTDDKKKILGQIITDFSSNKKLNNNIFDDGNQLTLNPKEKENNIDFNNNIINNNLTININEEKEKDDIKNKNKFQKENKNNIQEIKIKSFNVKNISQKTIKLSISSSRGNLYKKRPFYIVGINNFNKKINKETDNSNTIGISNKFSNKVTSPSNILKSQNLLENVRKRNKNYSQINSITYNDNLNYNKFDSKDDEDKEKNKINNINNINNNISLNNKYNFYIKIGKNNNIDIKKDNKDINCEIKLTSPNREYKYKEDISPQIIKKLIVECDIDKLNKINKNISLNKPNKKGINVNIKPLYKKIEIEKILVSNNNNNNFNNFNNNNNNKETKKTRANSYNKKSFKFLIHQAYNNKDLCTSFNRYYKSGQVLKERNLSIKNINNNKDNKNNNDSLNCSNSYLNSESNRPLGLNYNTDKKEKKYKNFYKSFRNIGRIRKKINLSYEENNNNNKIIKNNLTLVVNDNNNNNNVNNNNNINDEKKNTNNNLELTPLSPVSISITNENEDKSKLNLSNKRIKIHRMVYSMEGVENQNLNQINTPIPESRLIHSKINTSFSTDNSNLNSISSTYNNINNINNVNNNISSINSSISNNLSISFINLEIIYVLEEKLKIIIEKIKNDKNSSKECYDFINYYFSHNFYNDQLRIFNSGKNRKVINNYIKNEILCYFLCYDISFKDEFKQTEILIKSIFNLLHQNFLSFLALIISNYKNKDNNIIILLNKIVKDNDNDNDINYKIMDENKYIQIIQNNLIKLIDYCKMIIENIYMKYLKGKNKYIQFPDSLKFINPISLDKSKLDILIANFFVQAFKPTSSEYNYDFLKKFFYSFLNHKQANNDIKENNSNNNNNEIESTPKTSKSKSNISININENNTNNYYHYLLPKIKNHKYTLVLDLDETLIYTQKNYFYNKGKANTVILRPGLLEFLHDMKPLFELVIFSSGTPDYVDPILKMIEKDEKFFDYILYRQHITTDENGDNIKNLNLIGRDLKNVIIIDDISKYFKLQKGNGICIKPFCGNILSDRKTLKTLNKVLQQIRIDADKTRDIRISLDKYKHLLYPVVCNENENENI